jgi:ATP-dependent Clp protease ATP-binding subunit ClpC
MKEIAGRLADYEIVIELTQAARVWLAEQGYDPAFGARPLRRTLQKQVESPLSVKLLRGEFKKGDVIVVDHNENEGLLFIRKEELMVKVPSQNVEIQE